jgi:hypothetical protein
MKLPAAAVLAFALAPIAAPAFAQDNYAPLAPGALAPPAAEEQEPAPEYAPAPAPAYAPTPAPAPAPTRVRAPAAVPPQLDDCPGCPPPRQYDSFEVIKKIKEIDRSRVINTTEVVPVVRYVPEPKPEVLYVRPSVTVVNFVTHRYRVTEQPVGFAAVPVRHVYPMGPKIKSCRYGSCRPLRVRG